MPLSKITKSRLEQFHKFRMSLCPAERLSLDQKLWRWQETISCYYPGQKINFTYESAAELFMALTEHIGRPI